MELKNTRVIHNSERGEIILGEITDGRYIIRKPSVSDIELLKKISELNSPYVAKIVDYDDDYVYLEYAEGTPLSECSVLTR